MPGSEHLFASLHTNSPEVSDSQGQDNYFEYKFKCMAPAQRFEQFTGPSLPLNFPLKGLVETFDHDIL